MKAMILNGSPKKKGSTSGLLGRAMGCFLAGWEVWHASIRTKKQFPEILQHLKEIDVLILAAPLYVDGIPSHVIEFLQEAEAFCRENHCRFVFYAISNNGFIEGSHNRVHLKMYECWCRRADVAWGGGIGVGGGEMFYVLSIVYPVIFAVFILSRRPCSLGAAAQKSGGLFVSQWGRPLLHGAPGRERAQDADDEKSLHPHDGSVLSVHTDGGSFYDPDRAVPWKEHFHTPEKG